MSGLLKLPYSLLREPSQHSGLLSVCLPLASASLWGIPPGCLKTIHSKTPWVTSTWRSQKRGISGRMWACELPLQSGQPTRPPMAARRQCCSSTQVLQRSLRSPCFPWTQVKQPWNLSSSRLFMIEVVSLLPDPWLCHSAQSPLKYLPSSACVLNCCPMSPHVMPLCLRPGPSVALPLVVALSSPVLVCDPGPTHWWGPVSWCIGLWVPV